VKAGDKIRWEARTWSSNIQSQYISSSHGQTQAPPYPNGFSGHYFDCHKRSGNQRENSSLVRQTYSTWWKT